MMLNCKNCGAPLSLEDAVCPYCGTPNEEAKAHIDTLKDLSEDLIETKSEVYEEVKKTKRGYNLLIIIAMLLLANLLLAPMHSATYEISDRIIASSLDNEEIKAQMDVYLENEEFIEFVVFYDKYVIDYHGFEDYNNIYYEASYYANIQKSVSNYYHQVESYGDPLVRACTDIKNFEDERAYVAKRELSDFTRTYLQKLDAQYETYIKTYLKLTDEDIASINDLTDSELVILATRRLNDE